MSARYTTPAQVGWQCRVQSSDSMACVVHIYAGTQQPDFSLHTASCQLCWESLAVLGEPCVPTSPPAVCAGHHSFALDVARMAQKQTYYRFVRHGRPKNGPRNWSMTVPALILTLLLNVLYVQPVHWLTVTVVRRTKMAFLSRP